jgi:hypothetical protein
VFAILGAIDFVGTYALVRSDGGPFYESNPLAAMWLKNYGWDGLAIFKVATTVVLAGIVLIIRRHRPRAAAILATAACLSVLAVALYSRNLLTLQKDPSGGKQNDSVKAKND